MLSSINRPNKITLKYHKQVLLKDRLFKNNNFNLIFTNPPIDNFTSSFGYVVPSTIRFNKYFYRYS